MRKKWEKLKGSLLKGSFDKACALTCRFQTPPLQTPIGTRTRFAKTTPGKNYPLVSARQWEPIFSAKSKYKNRFEKILGTQHAR